MGDEIAATSAADAVAALRAASGRLFDAISRRRSRRSFDGTPVATDDLEAIEAFAQAFRPWPDARVVVVPQASQAVFAGIIGAYGGVSGAPSALVFVGGSDTDPARVGYTGQAVILEVTARGLDTCWVGGAFSAHAAAEIAGIQRGERVFAVSPLGHAARSATAKERMLFGMARAKHRRPLDEIAPGHQNWPAWAQAAVRAARLAPSAMNRQPWRFRMEAGTLVVAYAGSDTPRTSKRLDCGIAMMHAELGAASEGAFGRWELLAGRDVARFVPEGA